MYLLSKEFRYTFLLPIAPESGATNITFLSSSISVLLINSSSMTLVAKKLSNSV